MGWFSDVYFFRVSHLSKSLCEGGVSDYQALKHFILFTIIFSYSYEFPFLVYPEESFSGGLLLSVVSAVIHVVGIIWVFQRFAKSGGSEFFKKYAALSFPISICLLLAFSPIFVFLLFAMDSVGAWEESPVLSESVVILLEGAYAILFYRWISYSITMRSAKAEPEHS